MIYTGAKLIQSCPTLCDPMDCSQPDSPLPGTLPARILEWVVMPSSSIYTYIYVYIYIYIYMYINFFFPTQMPSFSFTVRLNGLMLVKQLTVPGA